jgi:hypothetical protein
LGEVSAGRRGIRVLTTTWAFFVLAPAITPAITLNVILVVVGAILWRRYYANTNNHSQRHLLVIY